MTHDIPEHHLPSPHQFLLISSASRGEFNGDVAKASAHGYEASHGHPLQTTVLSVVDSSHVVWSLLMVRNYLPGVGENATAHVERQKILDFIRAGEHGFLCDAGLLTLIEEGKHWARDSDVTKG